MKPLWQRSVQMNPSNRPIPSLEPPGQAAQQESPQRELAMLGRIKNDMYIENHRYYGRQGAYMFPCDEVSPATLILCRLLTIYTARG